MSCFKIPISVCTSIERECANLWSGLEAGRKKMHWKSWSELSKPKSRGGMGFRNLVFFNKALLAKQIWRIVDAPSSLVARVLKRSLLWSRELVDKGIRWRVGKGDKVVVCEHFFFMPLCEHLSVCVKSEGYCVRLLFFVREAR
ncbi:uncharacterized mitochondrial protein AtMg00310-like [Henckelia pumila]|uniref:uncharacterized mitochondrial protein AtMg00310-like n=1 Tax=Henckelia pumila TaxID=405737 RepID=UPI003C6DBBD6